MPLVNDGRVSVSKPITSHSDRYAHASAISSLRSTTTISPGKDPVGSRLTASLVMLSAYVFSIDGPKLPINPEFPILPLDNFAVVEQ